VDITFKLLLLVVVVDILFSYKELSTEQNELTVMRQPPSGLYPPKLLPMAFTAKEPAIQRK